MTDKNDKSIFENSSVSERAMWETHAPRSVMPFPITRNISSPLLPLLQSLSILLP
uniref:Uncharacterized protein n=1 Tax=Candidatus Kentrum sp. FW TaxID=2126338 RepID=A0A450SDH7_9GAMM|nr:MAG: hypothetical protein BECKFW1821A_GA0114235_10284 [Candidatus Kentron sp. FW]